MNILVVGSGAREHAIAWKLRQSPKVDRLYVAPGNAGTAATATNLNIPATDLDALAEAVRSHHVDLTVVGPETPLAEGIVDHFQEQGLAIFGPTMAAARLESSKVFGKQLMLQHHIPTPRAEVFSAYEQAKACVEQAPLPTVVKADGLAAGKGVTVCRTREEAQQALYQCMVAKAFGAAGEKVLVEECLSGREVSIFAFTDGTHISPLVAACDYKRLLDGDRGPNTGGMGSYSPPEFWTPGLCDTILRTIIEPTLKAMREEGTPYRGVLYAGLMLTQEGPKVLEFNCRLGDPETQAILPRLRSDLVDILLGVVSGKLADVPVEWAEEACVGIVLASGGYPGEYRKGYPIRGLRSAAEDALVFHAGTRLGHNEVSGKQVAVTDGGRVLTVAACGQTLREARERAYSAVRHIRFEGMHYRRDIALVASS
ncbi:MAG: phosphoribosylamine--glycine ligase [Chloroflexi bacterium]|nr:phosphoribosylamine--glycine ligase [Chloroflexota bacterium]